MTRARTLISCLCLWSLAAESVWASKWELPWRVPKVNGVDLYKISKNGTKEYFDGSKEDPDGTWHYRDGSTEKTDGTIIDATGNVTKPDGTIHKVDGTTILPDRTIIRPDKIRILPDGTAILRDGERVPPDDDTRSNGFSLRREPPLRAPFVDRNLPANVQRHLARKAEAAARERDRIRVQVEWTSFGHFAPVERPLYLDHISPESSSGEFRHWLTDSGSLSADESRLLESADALAQLMPPTFSFIDSAKLPRFKYPSENPGQIIDLRPQLITGWDAPASALMNFFYALTGERTIALEVIALGLKQYGATYSQEFCKSFLARQAPHWSRERDEASGHDKLLQPRFMQDYAQATAERRRLKELLCKAAAKQCLDWPLSISARDERVRKNLGGDVHTFRGQIILHAVKDFRMLRNQYPEALMVLQTSPDPAAGLASLSVVPEKFGMLYDLPLTQDDIRSADGDKVQPLSWLRQAEAYAAAFRALGGQRLADEGGETGHATSRITIAEKVRAALTQKPKEQILLLIAHCSAGKLKFTDNSEMAVSEVSQAQVMHAPVIVIACDTIAHFAPQPGLQYATARDISYREALGMAKTFRKAFDVGRSVGDACLDIQMQELKHNGFEPNPKNPVPTGQASLQLVKAEATGKGAITFHSNSQAMAWHCSLASAVLVAYEVR